MSVDIGPLRSSEQLSARKFRRNLWLFILLSISVCVGVMFLDGRISEFLGRARSPTPGRSSTPNVASKSTQSIRASSGRKANVDARPVFNFDGLWENSDGDLLHITKSGQKLSMKLLSSPRVSRGWGELTLSGSRLTGKLYAVFQGENVVRESSFNGTLTDGGEVTYIVGVDTGIESHSASMKKVNDRSGNSANRVTRIVDGDTFDYEDENGQEIRVRIFGIDAPEKNQPFGDEAKAWLESRILGKSVSVQVKDYDRNLRAIANVQVEEEDISLAMIRSGMAWWYRDYALNELELREAERSAKNRRLGLWREMNPIPPWEWRN